jgi:hypothetical protein
MRTATAQLAWLSGRLGQNSRRVHQVELFQEAFWVASYLHLLPIFAAYYSSIIMTKFFPFPITVIILGILGSHLCFTL